MHGLAHSGKILLPLAALAVVGCHIPRFFIGAHKPMHEREFQTDEVFAVDGRVYAHDAKHNVALEIDPLTLKYRVHERVAAFDTDCIARPDGTVIPRVDPPWSAPRGRVRFTRGSAVIEDGGHLSFRAKVDGVETARVRLRPVDAVDHARNRVWTIADGLASAGATDGDWIDAQVVGGTGHVSHLAFGHTRFAFGHGRYAHAGVPTADALRVTWSAEFEYDVRWIRFNERDSDTILVSTEYGTYAGGP